MAPFRSSVEMQVSNPDKKYNVRSDPVISGTQFGEYGHYRPDMVLDLSQNGTYLLERNCDLCQKNQKTFKTTCYGEIIPNSLMQFQYNFVNSSVDVLMEEWQDQTCINELCMIDYKFWAQA